MKYIVEFFEYWFMFPVSILIAAIATASGIGGSVFFSPIFIIILGIHPFTAIGAAIITEVFGFGSGMYGYIRARLVDYALAKNLLYFAIPAGILGALISGFVPDLWLEITFAIGILFVGWQIYLSYRKDKKRVLFGNKIIAEDFESKLTDRQGNIYLYTICAPKLARFFSLIGGMFYGMISVGLAELQEYQLIVKCRLPTRVAVATAIFLVAITALTASIVRVLFYVQSTDFESLELISQIVIFTAPGVLIGGQVGPLLQQKIQPDLMKLFISVLLVGVGGFMIINLMIF
ncbi:sulfite exporter TauE/SafE family protein [Alkalicoccus saliphilus]|uniref:Probable membrane transporter protein n=1 Tax=Alkalicoccus saliphilus TaxID=200989 RepID=A0A2T4U6Q6_9BACI|nr:sulfite exporter TauE/SafE family protein [Alkalicoccus saliphilus]PTL39084.1 sulfite exporter TauE/SafE family protein [Alkalicoccus saliphilus]